MSTTGTLSPLSLLHVDVNVKENTPQVFTWRGSLPGVFVGDHSFRFEKSSEGGKESTLLVHGEEFSGILSFVMGDGMVANWAGQKAKTQAGFEDFNRRFKAWVEEK